MFDYESQDETPKKKKISGLHTVLFYSLIGFSIENLLELVLFVSIQ